MCRPPDLPQAAAFQQQPAGAAAVRGGGYDLVRAAAALARGGAAAPATGLPVYSRSPSAAIGAASVAGMKDASLQLPLKRSFAACGGGAQFTSPFQVPAKMMRPSAPSVSSEFDDAASTFIARMEQSVIEDMKQQQQQLQQQQQQRSLLERYLAQSQQQQQLSGRLLPLAPSTPQPAAMDSWLRAAAGMSAGASEAMNASALSGPLAGAVTGLPASAMLSAASAAATMSGVPLLPLGAQLGPSAGFMGGGFAPVEVETEEKKAKRIMSNRASAKRSRQRRQERLEELERETEVLHADHAQVVAKLGRATQQLSRLEVENNRLMAELAALRKAAAGAGVPLNLDGAAPAPVSAAAATNGGEESAKDTPPSVFVDLLPAAQKELIVEEADAAPVAAAVTAVAAAVAMKGEFEFEQGSPESAVTDWSSEQQEQEAQAAVATAAAAAGVAAGEVDPLGRMLLDGLDCGGIGNIMEDELFSSLLSCFDATA